MMYFGYNPYYTPPYAPQMQRLQNLEQQYPQFAQQPQQSYPQNPQSYPQAPIGLQGKSVDSVDVVKAMDIPLDGSISYFPLTDGTAIVTKQLQADGTSKTVIYKPIQESEIKKDTPKYITEKELQEMLKEEPKDIKELKEEMKTMKRQLRDITDDLKDIKKKGDD